MMATGSQGKYGEADALSLRAIRIGEEAFGPDHPSVATSLTNRADMLHAQVMRSPFPGKTLRPCKHSRSSSLITCFLPHSVLGCGIW